MEKSKDCMVIEKLECRDFSSIDVSSNWLSTYSMLVTARVFEVAFLRLQDQDPYFKFVGGEGMPNQDDWENVKHLIQLLSHLYCLKLHISCSYISQQARFLNHLSRFMLS